MQSVNGLFPGFGIDFNSMAAGASVNHMHFQGFVRERSFPIENKKWRHNGGEIDYPLTAWRFDDMASAWQCLRKLIHQDVAFNCMYRGSSCYVIPRKHQGAVDLPDWLAGAGWMDVAGVMTVSNKEIFNTISSGSIQNSLVLVAI